MSTKKTESKKAGGLLEITMTQAVPLNLQHDDKRRKRVIDGFSLEPTINGVMVSGKPKSTKGLKVDSDGNFKRTVLVPWSQIQFAVVDD